MFILSELKSTVKVHPSLFSKPLSKVVEHEFNRKLANKVLYNGEHALTGQFDQKNYS